MEAETKKYLIIGTVIVVSVSVGVVLWRKYQSSSSASAAASDQANQDELALELAALSANAYAGQVGGAQSFTPAAVGAGIPQTLAQEVLALEQALGIAPPSTPTASGGSSGTSSNSTSISGSGTGVVGRITNPSPGTGLNRTPIAAQEAIQHKSNVVYGSLENLGFGVESEGVTLA